VKVIWQGRMAQTAAKYGEHASMATVCCNACRTCVQTNVIGLALGAATAVGVTLNRFARRLFRQTRPLGNRAPHGNSLEELRTVERT
jgi:hypothetical protein